MDKQAKQTIVFYAIILLNGGINLLDDVSDYIEEDANLNDLFSVLKCRLKAFKSACIMNEENWNMFNIDMLKDSTEELKDIPGMITLKEKMLNLKCDYAKKYLINNKD